MLNKRAIITQKNGMKGSPGPRKEIFYSQLKTSLLHMIPRNVEYVSAPQIGTIVYDTTRKSMMFYNGTGWVAFQTTAVDSITDPDVTARSIDRSASTPLASSSRLPHPEIPREFLPEESKRDFDPTDVIKTDGEYSVFSEKDFTLISEYIPTSLVKFDIPGIANSLRTITVPKMDSILPCIDIKNNVLLGSSEYDVVNDVGVDNTHVGTSAGKNNTEGKRNSSLGSLSLLNNRIGCENVGIGYNSLARLTYGDCNVAVGSGALETNNSNDNTAIGYQSQSDSSDGRKNTSVGYGSLSQMTSGKKNTCIGYNSGIGITSDNNIVVGSDSTVESGCGNCIVFGNNAKASSSGQLVISGPMSGLVQLQNGTGIVLLPSVTLASRILLTTQEPKGKTGFVFVAGRIAGTGFTVASSSISDCSVVGWFVFEP